MTRNARQRQSTTREQSTFTLSPHTIARLTLLAEASGLSRGRLIDMAIDGIEPCETCQGTREESPGERCVSCAGLGIVPTEGRV
jgi:DnaJ-class molecular chaperone